MSRWGSRWGSRTLAVVGATTALLARSSASVDATPVRGMPHGETQAKAHASPPVVRAVAPESDAAARSEARTFRFEGQGRRYRLHVPDAPPNAILPLVVAFHGAGATTAQQERASGLSALADRAGFVVVYPEGRERRWMADAHDERFVRGLVGDVARQVLIDPRRIYATGISNGAAMAHRAACAMSDLFAAVAVVAGAYSPGDVCRPGRAVPVLAFHGDADRIVPLAGRRGPRALTPIASWSAAWAARNGCLPAPIVSAPMPGVAMQAWLGCARGADVVLETIAGLGHAWPGDPTLPDGDRSPVDASAAMWAFFEAHPAP